MALLAGCGGDDAMQMCGADHCGLMGHTVVKWTFDTYPVQSFSGDSCIDFGVYKVHVEAVDSLGNVISADDDCGAAQVTFNGLAAGDYTVYVTPRDFNGNDVVGAPATGTVTAGSFGADTMVIVNVPYTAWIGTFTGTFLFRLTWGGQSCAAATPPVVTQVVTLSIGGVPVAAMADNGQKLDGTDPKPCYGLEQNFPQSATTLPFGPAQLTIEGRDGSNVTTFMKTFDTFVGAGITNPTITYDVPAL